MAGTLQGVPQVRGNYNSMPCSFVQRIQEDYLLTNKIVTNEKNGTFTIGSC